MMTPEEQLAEIHRRYGTPEEQLARIQRRYGTPAEQLAEIERHYGPAAKAQRARRDRRFVIGLIVGLVVYVAVVVGGAWWAAAHHRGGSGPDDPALEYLLGLSTGLALHQALQGAQP